METKTITKDDLPNVLQSINQTEFSGFVLDTNVRMRKTGNPFADHNIHKTSHFVAQLNMSYENMVKREREQEGADPEEFKAEKLPFGEWVGDGPLIQNRDQLYVRIYPNDWNPAETHYYDGEQEIPHETIKPWEQKSSKSTKRGTEKQRPVRTPKLESIKEIRTQNVRYVVVD